EFPKMKSCLILFREESRPPRLLTWPLVFLGAGAVWFGSRKAPEMVLFTVYALAGGLCAIFLLEFVAVAIEVTGTEVHFNILPFYRQRIEIANIQHWGLGPIIARPVFRPAFPGDRPSTVLNW